MKREGMLAAILAGLWILLVVGYWIWAAIEYEGLYRWLAELQVSTFGGYYARATATLPALIMCAPAIYALRRRAEAGEALAVAELGSEEARDRRVRRAAMGTAIFGLVACLVGAGAYAASTLVPDGSGPAIPFDAATLGSAPLPAGRVTIRGTIDEETGVEVTEPHGVSTRSIVYAGFRPEGDSAGGKDAPLRLFIQRDNGDGSNATTQVFMPEQSGRLVENGLPDPALREFEARRIAVASPHYVLITRDGGGRDTYYIVAALAGFLGLVCLIVAGIMAVQGRQLMARRQA